VVFLFFIFAASESWFGALLEKAFLAFHKAKLKPQFCNKALQHRALRALDRL
jgi:hypothetical protein